MLKLNEWERKLLIIAVIGLMMFTFGVKLLTFLTSVHIEYLFWALALVIPFRKTVILSRHYINKLKKADIKMMK